MRIRPSFSALAAVSLVVSLGATLGMTTTAEAARTEPPSAIAAKKALSDAQALRAGLTDGRNATMVLRELFKTSSALSDEDRAKVRQLFPRPTHPNDRDYYGPDAEVQSLCGTAFCVHWVETGKEASEPAFAGEVFREVETTHNTYVEAGYRPPIPDQGQGGSNHTDVYLANMGDDRLYGYCFTDFDANGQPDWVDGSTVAPFCAVDNDFKEFETDRVTALGAMQATVAHEYFHAVQFAYDALEDSWIMEATATWAEDEVYTHVNDNLNYLSSGQLGDPRTPLDSYGFQSYGNWIFFRFLTEQYTAEEGTMPYIVLELWELMDSTTGAPDLYSTQALEEYLVAQGSSLRRQYGDFAALNNAPAFTYEEGAGSDTQDAYPLPPYRFDPVVLTPDKRKTTWQTVKLNHLTSATGAFSPSDKMGSRWTLKIKVKMAKKTRGSEARVLVHYVDGGPVLKTVKLNKRGHGSARVPFDPDRVNRVEVVLANASSRMTCNQGDGTYSCSGQPLDDKQPASFRVMAKK